jgi:hypothetical protein
MDRIEEIRKQLGDADKRLAALDEGWTGDWECVAKTVAELGRCVKALRPPDVFDFELPARVNVRSARTAVSVKNIQTPKDWNGTVTWSWYLDGVLVHTGPDSSTELDTTGLWPGDHTLSVSAEFVAAQQAAAQQAAAAEASDRARLEELRFLESEIIEALLRARLETTMDVAENAGRPAQRVALAEATGLPLEIVQRTARLADVIRVSRVTPLHALVLEKAGVDSVRLMAQRNPANLHARFEAARAEVNGPAATLEDVVAWVNEAKELPQVVFNEDVK